MQIFVTGGNGVMGRSSIRALRDAGHDVVALVRSHAAADVVRELDARPVFGNVHDAASLVAGMQGCDVVANLATRIPVGWGALRPGSLKSVDRIRMSGAGTVVAAAQQAGVGRLIQQSLSFIYADAAESWIDEKSAIDVTRATEPLIVAEEHADSFAAGGGVAVSLRFGLVTGADRNTQWLLRRAARNQSIGLGSRESWMHLVHTDDVGTAIVAALGAPGGAYNVGADPVRRGDYADVIAQAAGRRDAHFLPGWVLRAGGEKLELLVRSQRVSSQRFTDRAGWVPTHPTLTPEWLDDPVRHA